MHREPVIFLATLDGMYDVQWCELKSHLMLKITPVRTEAKIRDRLGDDKILLVYDNPTLHSASF